MKRLNDSSDVLRSKAWNLVEIMYNLKDKDKAALYFLAEEWVLLSASTERAGGKFAVNSGACVRMSVRKTSTLLSWKP